MDRTQITDAMKPNWKHLDKWRNQQPPWGSPPAATYGSFSVPRNGSVLNIIATDGKMDAIDTEWEHVSIHAFDTTFKKQRIPSWSEMCFVKDLFWEPSEIVFQFHVAAADHINIHECVLHLWRPTKETIPLPPKICV